ncbi:shikimate dehydrogenase [uncultured Tessaracoccus sp.]|uniref:shikimate dehydrogenase family protein n=1 Tax=uncultured Tessaracoccus sp. TaxID=905023 RepID=UPI0025FD2DE9|nr:shikimate dehydrogenase [uncultured Tessaracoccus sp.]
MRRCAVIGDPAEHSLSPAMYRAGYARYRLDDWRYDAVSVASEDLDDFLRPKLEDPTWAGFSVTAPHKPAILALGEPDEYARLTGAGNTLCLGDHPTVHNTDVTGFIRALRAHRLPPTMRAVIVGNGATARSAFVALAELGTREIIVLARRPERAQALFELGADHDIRTWVHPLGTDPGLAGLLINTIPSDAVAPHAATLARCTGAVFDCVYDLWPTALARAAADVGTPVLDGLDLLAGQAVDQFRLLTGHEVGFRELRSAADQELRARRGV